MALRRGLSVAALALASILPSAPSTAAADEPPQPTPGAVDVRQFLGDRTDDTEAFRRAMERARDSSVRVPGPGGRPQAVVYAGPNTYRLHELHFPSDLRLEVDAGAVLQQVRDVDRAARNALIRWDAPDDGPPLSNVSLVAVRRVATSLKTLARPLPDGWSVDGSFTVDLDAERTGGSSFVKAIELENVDGFLIRGIFSVQNDSTSGAWPATSRAAIVLRSSNGSPMGGPYFHPRRGRIEDHVNVGAPRGFGPNQVNSAHDVAFARIYSRGGTALRLESDDARGRFGAEIAGITADAIVGERCNRAVALAPHEQWNRDVVVTGVVARSCHQGVVEAADEGIPADRRGAFVDSAVRDVLVIGGDGAQVPADGSAWRVGSSLQAYGHDAKATWYVDFSAVACSGAFLRASSPILLDGTRQRPGCT